MSIKKALDGSWVFDTVQEAIEFELAFGQRQKTEAPKTATPPKKASTTPTTENIHGIPAGLWDDLRKDAYKTAINEVIEAGDEGILVTALAERIGYEPKGVGGVLSAVRKSAERAGMSPDDVLVSKRVFVEGKQQSVLVTAMKLTK